MFLDLAGGNIEVAAPIMQGRAVDFEPVEQTERVFIDKPRTLEME
jgi:hypothetical protein